MMRKCSICYKQLSLSNLKTHEKTVHGESRVNCDQCDYQTGQKVSLRRHQLAMHVGQKRECSYCGKKYKWEVDLRRHITSYHKDKTFSCNDLVEDCLNFRAARSKFEVLGPKN